MVMVITEVTEKAMAMEIITAMAMVTAITMTIKYQKRKGIRRKESSFSFRRLRME